jgi:GntR family transcriptional regulator/MocR family aminotransferase
VTAAYQQLVDEGFLEARSRSGIFVAAQAAPRSAEVLPRAATAQALPAPDWAARMRRSLKGRPTLIKPERWAEYPYPFVYGPYDAALFPTEDFRECCVRSLARAQLTQWASDLETEDVPELVEQLRKRVLPRRGVFALPEEIVLTVGAQQAFHLLGEALFDTHTRVGFEEPGYPHARSAFGLREPQWLPLPVDEQGVVVQALPRLHYAFVTPSQHSPTTATLSLERRQALLQAAEARDFVIIEDDYEAENLLEGSPIAALKSLDRSGRVIYVGSLAKTLAPALRLGYVVAPAPLAAELRALRHAMVRHPSTFLQHAYALFIALGHHDSHARRVNEAMRERMQTALGAVAQHLSGFECAAPQGGASLWLRCPAWVHGSELAQAARAHGVLVEPGDVFFAQPPYPCPFIRLRLSSIAPARIEPGVQALAKAMRELAHARGERWPG